MALVADEHMEAAIHDSRVRARRRSSSSSTAVSSATRTWPGRAPSTRASTTSTSRSFDRDRDRDALIGRDAAERYTALPIAVTGRSLVVAFADPLDAPAIAEIVNASKLEVTPVVAGASAIEARLEELPENASAGAEAPQLRQIEGGEQARSGPPRRRSAAGIAETL